jgi:hypothetical protein
MSNGRGTILAGLYGYPDNDFKGFLLTIVSANGSGLKFKKWAFDIKNPLLSVGAR